MKSHKNSYTLYWYLCLLLAFVHSQLSTFNACQRRCHIFVFFSSFILKLFPWCYWEHFFFTEKKIRWRILFLNHFNRSSFKDSSLNEKWFVFGAEIWDGLIFDWDPEYILKWPFNNNDLKSLFNDRNNKIRSLK